AALDGDAVALELDVEATVEQASQRGAALAGQAGLAGCDGRIDGSARAPAEGNEVLGVALQPVELQVGLLAGERFEKRAGVEPQQPAVACLTRCQKHDPGPFGGMGMPIAGRKILIGKIDGKRAAYDRLDTSGRKLVGEFKRPKQVVRVG